MFKVLTQGCNPTRGSKYSACIDLYASHDVTIAAGDTEVVGLGVAIDCDFFVYDIAGVEVHASGEVTCDDMCGERVDTFMKSHYLKLNPKRSLRAKGLISHTEIINLDFEEEIKIIIHNPLMKPAFYSNNSGEVKTMFPCVDYYAIKKGDKIAQITLMEHNGYLLGIDTE